MLGPSGGGKSLQLLNWAFNAHKQGKNVLYFSFELSLWDCLLRHMSLAFNIPFQDIKRNSLMDEDVISLASKLRGMQGGPYFEYDFTDSDPTPEYVDMRIRELSLTKGKPDIVIADYIGEMRTRNAPKTAKSWELHELAFDGLVKIARRHNLPVLTAQQLNRTQSKIQESPRTQVKHTLMISLLHPVDSISCTKPTMFLFLNLTKKQALLLFIWPKEEMLGFRLIV